jgi:Flp pilus assembly secretin CpaC
MVENFLRRKQAIVERQVMLEAKIIEVTLRDSQQTGINWAAFRAGPNSRFGAGVVTPGTTLRTDGAIGGPTARAADGSSLAGSGLSINPAAANPLNPDPLSSLTGAVGSLTSAITSGASSPGTLFGLAFQTSNFAALLVLPRDAGRGDVLSSPRIATLNNQKAVLKVGTDEFFVTNVTTTRPRTGTTSVQASPTITVQPFFSGIALDVTPQIDGENNIILHVHPSVSQVSTAPRHRPGHAWAVPAAAGLQRYQRDRLHRARAGRQHRRHRRADADPVQQRALAGARAWATCPDSARLFRNDRAHAEERTGDPAQADASSRSTAGQDQDLLDTQERIRAMRRPVTTIR